MSAQTQRKLWDVDDLADYLKVNPSWVYKRTSKKGKGSIPHIKMGPRLVRFDPDSQAFKDWLKTQTAN